MSPPGLRWSRLLRAPAVNLTSYPLCALVLRHAAPSPGDAVLDVGCGAGLLVHALAGRPGRLVAVDRSREAIAALSGAPGVEGHVVDATEPPPRWLSGQFDRVLCVDVLEHVDDPPSLLRFVSAALRPGGLAVLTFPVDDPAHGRLVPREDVGLWVEQLGLDAERRFVSAHAPLAARLYLSLRRRLPLPETDRFEETLASRLQAGGRRGALHGLLYGALRLALVGAAWALGDFLREPRAGEESRRCVLLIRGRPPAMARRPGAASP